MEEGWLKVSRAPTCLVDAAVLMASLKGHGWELAAGTLVPPVGPEKGDKGRMAL